MVIELITRRQLARIWASAQALKLSREKLYALVPGGSLSHLTRHQAAEVINKLNQLESGLLPPATRPATAGKRAGKLCGTGSSVPTPAVDSDSAGPAWQMTAAQRALIHHLFERLGWTDNPRRVQGFLKKYAHVDDLDYLTDKRRAIAVIEALKAILARTHRARPARRDEGGERLLAPEETRERHELN